LKKIGFIIIIVLRCILVQAEGEVLQAGYADTDYDDSKISLCLVAVNDVQMEIVKDGNTVFCGIFRKGKEKSWTADKQIFVMVTELEKLEFIVNDKYFGMIGTGIRNLVIDENSTTVFRKRIYMQT